jgi:hypothetical protein
MKARARGYPRHYYRVLVHSLVVERHICTSEWAVGNLLPSNGAGPRISREAPSSSRAGGRCGADVLRNGILIGLAMGATPLINPKMGWQSVCT